jgi:hypothetical protein
MNNSQQTDRASGKGGGDTSDLEKLDLDDVYKKLDTTPQGLSAAEAAARLTRYGRQRAAGQADQQSGKIPALLLGPHPLYDRGRCRSFRAHRSLV